MCFPFFVNLEQNRGSRSVLTVGHCGNWYSPWRERDIKGEVSINK